MLRNSTSKQTMKQTRVAVVDDDFRIRDLLAYELEDLGSEVIRCCEGSELLAFTDFQLIDLVLLDWMMPGLAGAATLQQLRARGYRGRVVVVTALCDPMVKEQALALGATSVLLKTEVLPALAQLLNPD